MKFDRPTARQRQDAQTEHEADAAAVAVFAIYGIRRGMSGDDIRRRFCDYRLLVPTLTGEITGDADLDQQVFRAVKDWCEVIADRGASAVFELAVLAVQMQFLSDKDWQKRARAKRKAMSDSDLFRPTRQRGMIEDRVRLMN